MFIPAKRSRNAVLSLDCWTQGSRPSIAPHRRSSRWAWRRSRGALPWSKTLPLGRRVQGELRQIGFCRIDLSVAFMDPGLAELAGYRQECVGGMIRADV